MKIETTRLDFMRHGQPEGGQLYRGHGVDDPLSEKGWWQMKNNSQLVNDWEVIITSPMQRCLSFAQYLSKERNIDYHIIDDLKEVGFGDWEGKSRQWLKENRLQEYQDFYLNPVLNRPKGAEPLQQFKDRISHSIELILKQYTGKKCLIIAHAGVIRASLGWCINAPIINWYQAQVDPGSISRFSYNKKQAKLEFFNYYPL
ncbi:MAG: histidine phosphatase family protein [Gammaproteobacteria bacterium]|nr:histidine phosphatase family protein [Gammaproteobacteria bacterium]